MKESASAGSFLSSQRDGCPVMPGRSSVIRKHPLQGLLLFLFVDFHCLGVIVNVGRAGGMVRKAGGAVGGGHILGAVVDAGFAPTGGLVPAMNAKPRLGGNYFAAFGAIFE